MDRGLYAATDLKSSSERGDSNCDTFSPEYLDLFLCRITKSQIGNTRNGPEIVHQNEKKTIRNKGVFPMDEKKNPTEHLFGPPLCTSIQVE